MELDVEAMLQDPLEIRRMALVFGHTVTDVETLMGQVEDGKAQVAYIYITQDENKVRVELCIFELLKQWSYKVLGSIITYAIIGETNCAKSTSIASMIQKPETIKISNGKSYGTGKADPYIMGFEHNPDQAYVKIIDNAGITGVKQKVGCRPP